jgi:hypothetical protein
LKEEEGRGKKEREENKRRKEKEKSKKRKIGKGKERNRKSLEKIGEILGKIRREVKKDFCGFFLGFSDTGVNSGTVVMARRAGRRVHGGAGFPPCWPTTALGRHAGRRPECGLCRRDSRHARRV